jgi:hypothetical protein
MPRPQNHPIDFDFPQQPDPDLLPRAGDRPYFRRLHAWFWGPISTSQLREWPIEWRYLNGRAIGSTREFIAEAQRRYDDAPVLNVKQPAR